MALALYRVFSPRLSEQLQRRRHPATTHKRSPKKVVCMLSRQAYSASLTADIDARFNKALPLGLPAVVDGPVRHLVSAATKTLAPELCVAACELVGGSREHAMDAACALRLMHAGACGHRLLPALGGGGGGEYKSGSLLLAGDGVLTLGYELLGRCSTVEPARALRAVVEIADAMGAAQAGEEWERAEERLCGSGAACGAILGGAGEEVVERLRRCGRYSGMMHGLLRGNGGKKVEAATRFKSLARRALEEEEFDEEKTMAFLELLDCWYEEGLQVVFQLFTVLCFILSTSASLPEIAHTSQRD